MSWLVMDGQTRIAKLEMGAVPSKAVAIGNGGEDVVAWVTAGCPSLEALETEAGISETPILVPPSDELWGLAFLDAVEERGWEVFDERELGGPGSGRYPKGSGQSKSIVDKHGNVYPILHDEGSRTYQVGPEENFPLASATLGYDRRNIVAVGVDPELQRKGIASALYDYIEEDLGYPLEPYGTQSTEGKAFWDNRKKLKSLGGPGSGRYPKGSGENPSDSGASYYHGTSLEAAKKIKEEGIKADHLAWVASDERTAVGFGYQRTTENGEFAVVVIEKTPESQRMVGDHFGDDAWGTYASRTTIPPSMIREVRVYSKEQFRQINKDAGVAMDQQPWKMPEPLHTLSGELLYGVVLFDELKALGGPGSGRYPKGSGEHPRGGVSFPTNLTKISSKMGSNPGGVYKDEDGQKWYVKNYRDPEQAYGEHLSNGIYEAAGINAPVSVLGEKKGEYASKWLDDVKGTLQSEGLDKAKADQVLDGFAADVLLSNWDTVGLTRDNVAVHGDGSITRIDQGGTLLHRAQGAPKPAAALESLSEWEFFSSGNKEYRDVFKAAGVKNGDALGQRAVDQIDRLTAARPAGGWSEFVSQRVPQAPAAWKAKVSKVLETRHKLLLEKRKELSARSLGGPGSGRYPKGSGEHSRAMAALSGLQKKFGEIIPQGEIFKGYDLNHEAVSVYNDGIDTSRPGTIESIDPRKILATQDEVDVTGLTHYLNGTGQEKSEPIILRLGGENFVVEGHHRVGAALLRGDATVQAEVYDAGKLLGLGGPGSGRYPKGSGENPRGGGGLHGRGSLASFVKPTAEQRKELKLPPAWTNVLINPDPEGEVVAVGTDKKGRQQRRYSAAHTAAATAEKFERLKAFNETLPGLRTQIENDLASSDPHVQESATLVRLIDRTAFRIGSNRDTMADKKAYGASTLKGSHVKIKGDDITFKFVGKKGVDIKKTVTDAKLARALESRINGKEALFPIGSDTRVRDYLATRAPGFTPKDFRTYHGTAQALKALNKITIPKGLTKTQAKKLRLEVAKHVAAHLGNTPAVSLSSYINPAVFGKLTVAP